MEMSNWKIHKPLGDQNGPRKVKQNTAAEGNVLRYRRTHRDWTELAACASSGAGRSCPRALPPRDILIGGVFRGGRVAHIEADNTPVCRLAERFPAAVHEGFSIAPSP